MNICFVSSEITPFAKTGGLADVAGALGTYLAKNGLDVRLIMPLYAQVDTKKHEMVAVQFARSCEVRLGAHRFLYDVFTLKESPNNAQYYFIHCPALYTRPAIYTNDADEYLRFALLNVAAIEFCQRMGWSPDIFHCNDWQSALIPLYLKTLYSWDSLFKHSKTLLTIHNLAYQGAFPADIINDLNLASYYKLFDAAELYAGRINFLQTGLKHADYLNTVSPTYAKEIQTETYGEGLSDILRARADRFSGILNGVDYQEWNPQTDKHIPYHYNIKNLGGKKRNKKVLLKELNLPFSENAPVLAMITRLVEQKGIDLLKGSIERILDEYDIRLIVLASGQPEYEHYLYFLQLQYPDKVVFYQGYNYELAHLIEAGADIFLMPSRYEPCGLNQIYSLKYGTVPVVRKTGGLADTVRLYDWKTQKGTGFVFEHYTPDSLFWALEYAVTTFANKKAWRKIQIEGMKEDFSWDKQVKEYVRLYQKIVKL